jgi:hypothetical protein
MGQNRSWLISLFCASLALFAATSQAAPLVFSEPVEWFVDTTGDNTGLTPIANTPGNIGAYAAGSWLTVSGNVTGAMTGGIPLTGNFAAQKAPSGVFSTGNPGSLVSYYDGEFYGGVTNNSFGISVGGFESARTYNGLYPQKAGPAIALSPQIGGGISGAAGSSAADYGANLSVKALGSFTYASGTIALRDFNVSLRSNLSSVPLSGTSPSQTFDMLNNFQIEVAGALDYNLKGGVVLGNTTPDIIGSLHLYDTPMSLTGAGTGTLTRVDLPGSHYYLMTMPITTTFVTTIPGDSPLTASFTLTGQIVAQGFPFPEPSTIVIAGSAAIPLGLMAWRRRKRVTAR